MMALPIPPAGNSSLGKGKPGTSKTEYDSHDRQEVLSSFSENRDADSNPTHPAETISDDILRTLGLGFLVDPSHAPDLFHTKNRELHTLHLRETLHDMSIEHQRAIRELQKRRADNEAQYNSAKGDHNKSYYDSTKDLRENIIPTKRKEINDQIAQREQEFRSKSAKIQQALEESFQAAECIKFGMELFQGLFGPGDDSGEDQEASVVANTLTTLDTDRDGMVSVGEFESTVMSRMGTDTNMQKFITGSSALKVKATSLKAAVKETFKTFAGDDDKIDAAELTKFFSVVKLQTRLNQLIWKRDAYEKIIQDQLFDVKKAIAGVGDSSSDSEHLEALQSELKTIDEEFDAKDEKFGIEIAETRKQLKAMGIDKTIWNPFDPDVLSDSDSDSEDGVTSK